MKIFNTIWDFLQYKSQCPFCQENLHASLTNFVGVKKTFLPILNIPVAIKPYKFTFQIKHTTSSYDMKANGMIDTRTNALIFTVIPNSTDFDNLTLDIDRYVAKSAFDDLKPHFDLFCNNQSCPNRYYLSSSILQAEDVSLTKVWIISPLKLYLEGFETPNEVVQNDWLREETNIYSIIKDADPVKFQPIIDFTSMSKEALLNRVLTIKNWS